MKRPKTLMVLLGLLALTLFVVTPASVAAAPSNDNFADATVVTGLPFNSGAIDVTQATTEFGEPYGSFSQSRTVWFSFAPTSDAKIRADTGTSNDVGAFWAVYRQDSAGFGGLNKIASGGYIGSTFNVDAGKTYYIQAGDSNNYGWLTTLGLKLEEVPVPPAPANDTFAAATEFSSLPFSDSGDLVSATVEPGEPQASPYYPPKLTAWYRFVPSTSGHVTASGSSIMVAAFTGSKLDQLTLIDSRELAYGQPLTVSYTAGTPIYFQVVAQFGGSGGDSWPFTLSLYETPAPWVGWSINPNDPSSFDTVYFQNYSYDPANVGISTCSWNFGDGTTSSDWAPTHQYAKDGDYSPMLTVTTTDGRSASQSWVVSVRTHDVSILSFSTPKKARVGETIPISIGVGNTRYAEDAQVEFTKSTPNGFDLIGWVYKTVPAMKKGKTTSISINYTITEADLAMGKVTFQARIYMYVRDALPGDNNALSPQVLITK